MLSVPTPDPSLEQKLAAVHFGANPSPRGLRESAGIMVNYQVCISHLLLTSTTSHFLLLTSYFSLPTSHFLLLTSYCNYQYVPELIEANHSAYVSHGTIAAAPAVWQLVEGESDQ